MKKSFRLFMTMLLIGGFASSFSSCSDKDVNDSNVEIPGDPYGKTTENAEALFNILGAAAGLDSLPDNWKQSNFTVEPIIGKVMDESDPYVRTIASESTQEAIDIFNGYTGSNLASDATSGSWNKDGVGSINLKVVNKDGVYATMDIHVPQMPHLTQLRFVEKSLLGENAGEKAAYYKIGDVVKVDDHGEIAYWTCVRSCDPSHNKYVSHWVSFQLKEKNYKTYAASKNVAQQVVPTQLGYNGDTDRMLKHTVELLAALKNPSIYDEEHFSKGLGELGSTYEENDVYNIANEWAERKLFNKVLPDQVVKENWFNDQNLYKQENPDTIFFYVNGYHRLTKLNDITLDGRKVWMDKNNNSQIESFTSKWTPDNSSFNIKTYVESGQRTWTSVDNSRNVEGRTKNKALVVRYKTGSQLCGTTAKYDKPFTPKSGITIEETYHYASSTKAYVCTIGDMVKDSEGAIWTCVLSPCTGNNKTIFVTTDGIKISSDGQIVINEDLPTINDIFQLFPFLCFYQNSQNLSDAYKQLTDRAQGAFPADDYLQQVQYLGDKSKTGHRTTFAVKSSKRIDQQLLRMYEDLSNRNNTAAYKGFTTYQGKPNWNLYLKDADMLSTFKDVIDEDTLVNKFWLPNKNGPVYRTKRGHPYASSYLYQRYTSAESKWGFVDPDDYYSIFLEPVAIFRIKILKGNEANDFTMYQRTPLQDINLAKEILGNWFMARSQWKDNFVFLDGKHYDISD